MFKNLTKKQIIIIVAVGVVVIGLIIFLVMRNKKKKKQMELEQAEKNFVPMPLPKEDANNFVPARRSQVIPEEDLRNESSKAPEAVIKSINRPAQPTQPAQQKQQAKPVQPVQPAKKEVPFTPIMEEDRELVDEMNKADQDKRGGVSIGN
jgi:flagellar biosynthesis/type III secretory pathway M-ring protein FliF/YscJ